MIKAYPIEDFKNPNHGEKPFIGFTKENNICFLKWVGEQLYHRLCVMDKIIWNAVEQIEYDGQCWVGIPVPEEIKVE